MRRNLIQCSVVSTYDTAIAYTKNEDFNSGGTGGFTANTGTVSNPTGNQLHMTANWASKPLATTSVYLVNGRSYTLNLDIVGFSVVSGFSHTVRVRVVLPGAAFNTDFTTTGTKTITFTSNTTGYVNIEIRSIISPPTGVYSGNPYIDIDNFKVSWDSAFTSSDTICVIKSGYRFGFNGMEKVDEVSGEGNGYDFGARMYDGRLGRWFSVDPYDFYYIDISTYNYCDNNPILNIELDGSKFKDSKGRRIRVRVDKNGNVTVKFNKKTSNEDIMNFYCNTLGALKALAMTKSGRKDVRYFNRTRTEILLIEGRANGATNDNAKFEPELDDKDQPRMLKTIWGGHGIYRKVTITYFMDNIARKASNSNSLIEEILGATLSVEAAHSKPEQIKLDKAGEEGLVNESEQYEPLFNIFVNFRYEFRVKNKLKITQDIFKLETTDPKLKDIKLDKKNQKRSDESTIIPGEGKTTIKTGTER